MGVSVFSPVKLGSPGWGQITSNPAVACRGHRTADIRPGGGEPCVAGHNQAQHRQPHHAATLAGEAWVPSWSLSPWLSHRAAQHIQAALERHKYSRHRPGATRHNLLAPLEPHPPTSIFSDPPPNKHLLASPGNKSRQVPTNFNKP